MIKYQNIWLDHKYCYRHLNCPPSLLLLSNVYIEFFIFSIAGSFLIILFVFDIRFSGQPGEESCYKTHNNKNNRRQHVANDRTVANLIQILVEQQPNQEIDGTG